MASKSDHAYEFLRQSIIAGNIGPDVPLRIQKLGKTQALAARQCANAL